MARTVKRSHTMLLVPANHVPENRLARHRTGPSHRVRFAERLVMQPNEMRSGSGDRRPPGIRSWRRIRPETGTGYANGAICSPPLRSKW